MRDRSSVVIVNNQKVALIKRVKEDAVYYVFPGGGIEQGESPEEAARREAFEELGVGVKVKECIKKVWFNDTQYYFLSEITNGTFGTGQGEEYTDTEKYLGTHEPMWIDIEELSSINVVPKEIVVKLQSLFHS